MWRTLKEIPQFSFTLYQKIRFLGVLINGRLTRISVLNVKETIFEKIYVSFIVHFRVLPIGRIKNMWTVPFAEE